MEDNDIKKHLDSDNKEPLDTYGGITYEQAEKIRNLYISRREQLKLSQRELAKQAGINQNSVSLAERSGYLSMRAIDFLKMICLGYGVEPNDVAKLLGLLNSRSSEQSIEREMKLKTILAGLGMLSNDDLDVAARIIRGMASH